MLTIKGAERAVEAAMAELDRRIQGIAERAREERVIPTCRRIGGSFSSGMGTFSNERNRKEKPDHDARETQLDGGGGCRD